MAENIFRNAINKAQKQAITAVQRKPVVRLASGALKPAHQATTEHKFESQRAVSVNGTVPSTGLTSASVIDFQILCPQQLFLKDLALEWSCSNSDGVNFVTPIPAPLFCDIEFWVNGGSKLIQTIYSL